MPHFYRLILVLTLAALLLVAEGCGGGGGRSSVTKVSDIVVGDPTGAASTGRLVYRTRMRMADEFFTNLSAADRTALQARGVQIIGSELVFPDVPVQGEWVELGGRRYMTGTDGTVLVDASAVGGTARLFRQLTDAVEMGSFAAAGAFVPSGQTPPVTAITRTLNQVGPMNSEIDPDASRAADICVVSTGTTGASRAVTRAGCRERDTSACAGNSAPCCLDYDNPNGDHKAYFRTIGEKEGPVPIPTVCGMLGVRNFVDSTCYNWSFGLAGKEQACDNERAFAWNGSSAPDCWNNHRYRNCQHMEADGFRVNVTGSKTVRPGQTVEIKIYNNTKSNESGVVVRPDDSGLEGKLSGEGLDGETLLHYDDGARKHFEERTITFTAPQLPQGKATVVNTVRVRAGGKTDDVEITVTDQLTWKGKFTVETIGGHHGVGWPDRPNFSIKTDMNVTLRGTIGSTGQGVASVGGDSTFSWTASGFQDYGGGSTLRATGGGSKAFNPPDNTFSAFLDTKKGTAQYSFVVHQGGGWSLVSNETNVTPQVYYTTSNEFGGPIIGTLGPDLTLKGGTVTRTAHGSTGDYTIKLTWSDIPVSR